MPDHVSAAEFARVVSELRRENQVLRVEIEQIKRAPSGPTPDAETDDGAVSRRRMLKRLGGAVAGAGLAAVAFGERPAAAGQGTMLYGATNDSGPDATELTSTSTGFTLRAINTGNGLAIAAWKSSLSSTSPAISALTNGLGSAVYGEIANTSNANSAVWGDTNGSGNAVFGQTSGTGSAVKGLALSSGGATGVTGIVHGSGSAVHGEAKGTGSAVRAMIDNAGNSAAAVYATTNGGGRAIHGVTSVGEAIRGETTGTGSAVRAMVENAENGASSVFATTVGSGPGLTAQSNLGFGVVATGGRAALVLSPRGVVGPPSTDAGAAGGLVTDANGTLFQNKGGTWFRVGYNPLTNPFRLIDTRLGSGPLGPGERRALTVAPSGPAGNQLPAVSRLSAVVLNVTAVDGTADSYFTVMPHDAPAIPAGGDATYSNVNWKAGQLQANQATVRVAPNGQIAVFNRFGSVHLVIDVMGFYT